MANGDTRKHDDDARSRGGVVRLSRHELGNLRAEARRVRLTAPALVVKRCSGPQCCPHCGRKA